MTTFEITIIVLLMAIVMLLIIAFIGGIATINARIKESCQYFDKKVEYCSTKLGYINGTVQSISQQLNDIDNNILDKSRGIPALVDIVDKMHRNLCVEIADKMVDRAYPPTRTIKVKGKRCELTDEELMKRINEDNKED